MTRKATMNQLFNLIQDEYKIKSTGDIEAALLNMFYVSNLVLQSVIQKNYWLSLF